MRKLALYIKPNGTRYGFTNGKMYNVKRISGEFIYIVKDDHGTPGRGDWETSFELFNSNKLSRLFYINNSQKKG